MDRNLRLFDWTKKTFGRLLGLFPINFLHNIVHLGVGVWGVLGVRTISGVVTFSRGIAIFYGLLAGLGLFPVTDTSSG